MIAYIVKRIFNIFALMIFAKSEILILVKNKKAVFTNTITFWTSKIEFFTCWNRVFKINIKELKKFFLSEPKLI